MRAWRGVIKGSDMHVRFIGEADDGISISSHHARALASKGIEVSFECGANAPAAPTKPNVIHVATDVQANGDLLRDVANARAAGCAVMRVWRGRDVLWAVHHRPSLEFAQAISELGATQLAHTDELVAQLRGLGISTTTIPPLTINLSSTADPAPLPGTFTALCRLPDAMREFYGSQVIDRLIVRFSLVRFLMLGGGQKESGKKNVEHLGQVEDICRTIKRATVLIEPRLDGGLSRLALEALSLGRHVISTHRCEHSLHATSVDEFADQLRSLQDQAKFNLAGREFACRQYEREAVADALIHAINDCAKPDRGSAGARRAAHRIVAALPRAGAVSDDIARLPEPGEVSADAPAFQALLCAELRRRDARTLAAVAAET